MERPESATKVPEAGSRISPALYCTSTRRPRKAEYRAILYSVSETSSNRVNSTKGLPPKNCGKTVARMWKNRGEKRAMCKTAQSTSVHGSFDCREEISGGKVLRRRGSIFPARRPAGKHPKTPAKRNSYNRKSLRSARRGRAEVRAAL